MGGEGVDKQKIKQNEKKTNNVKDKSIRHRFFISSAGHGVGNHNPLNDMIVFVSDVIITDQH